MLLAALVLQSTGDGGDPTGGWKVWITAQADAIGSRATIAAAGAAAGLKDGLHAAADGLTDGVHVTLSTGRAAYAQHGPLLREKGTEAAEHLRATTAGLENTARKASSNVREALNDAAPIVRAAVASSVTYLKPLGASFGEGYTDLLADASSTVHEAFNDAAPIVRAAVASSVTELKALGGWVGEGYTDLLAELELIVAEQRAAAAARARGRDGHATTTKGKRCSFATHAVAEKAFRYGNLDIVFGPFLSANAMVLFRLSNLS